jgi:hypothetical protein
MWANSCRRFTSLIRVAEFRRGADALSYVPHAPYDDGTAAVIEELHPPRMREIPEALLTPQPGEAPVQIDAAGLKAVLRRLKRKVAPGPSRLTNDHLRQLFPPDSADDDPNLGLLLFFVNKVLAGDVDAETVDWLCASNLVVLLKLNARGEPKPRRPV